MLENLQEYELDDSLYLPIGTEPSLSVQVNVLPLDPMRKRLFDGQQYLLGIEQIRDAIVGLEFHRSANGDSDREAPSSCSLRTI